MVVDTVEVRHHLAADRIAVVAEAGTTADTVAAVVVGIAVAAAGITTAVASTVAVVAAAATGPTSVATP